MKSAVVAFLLGLIALPASAQPAVMATAPVKNFKLPIFNQAGVRTSLLRGGEARHVNATQIDIVDMQYISFAEDGSNRVETTLLAPSASVLVQRAAVKVHGEESVRVIDDKVEATGEKWTYDHTQKRISIEKKVRVVFRAEIKDLLK